MPKKTDAALGEFAFFKFLLTFYQQNKKRIRVSYRDLSKKFLDFNDPENAHAFLRTPQFEALEIYVFLKEFLDNKRIEQIFKEWYEKEGVFADRAEGGVAADSGQISLFEDVSQKQYEDVFKAMRKNARAYPNYIFALTMGTGKTILMATCIFYEFILANKWKKDPKYCHNALVFSPDKTVLLSLRELETFELSKVVPPEYVNFLTSHIRFHFLEEAGTSLDTLDQSMFNVIVSNTQKIILKRKNKEKTAIDDLFGATPDTFKESGSVYADAADLYDFDTPEEEGELTTNQRFEKLTRLGQLGIYVDEAHHAFGKKLAKDMGIGAKETDNSLRTTIDKLASRLERAGTRVVACFNYTGTPYIGQTVLPEVVYAYGLSDAIANEYLKKADLHGYSNTKSEEFLRIAINDFLEQTGGLRPEGLLPKMAIFATTIDEVRNELQPLVAKILEEKGLPADSILVNLGDDKTTNDDIREFIRLDTPGSHKQFILLVNKGREGWNCRSLFSVAMFRTPKSKVFVLQATMRCFRSIGETQHTAHVYLSAENLQILNDELSQNFRLSADDLNNANSHKQRYDILVKEPVERIKLQRVRRSFELIEKELAPNRELGINRADKSAWQMLTGKYNLLETVQSGIEPSQIGKTTSSKTIDRTELRQKVEFSEIMLVSEVARYLGRSPLEIEAILQSTGEGIQNILDAINEYNELLYDVVIPRLFGLLYDLEQHEIKEEHEVELVRLPENGSYSVMADPKLVVRDDDVEDELVSSKSFHLDTYAFDSRPEQTLFWDLIREGAVKKLYFTGMLTHGQSEFFIQYVDPESRMVRSYYPDFLFEKDDGTYVIVEVKGDNMIDDPIVQAKREYAEQMAEASGMEYAIIRGTDAEAHNFSFLLPAS